ncbi:MAG: hypothetical protein GQ582_06560 [Methyloprofundus sp.]|nr:hypothetical protein [Methyloprofundus sp.]
MRNSFFLVIPAQREDKLSLKMYEEDLVRRWIDELPIANASLTTRLLHDFIAESNKLVMSAAMRMTYLEILRDRYLMIEEGLFSQLMGSGFPKSEDEQKAHHTLISIEQELATAYWIVVRNQSRRLSWFQGKEVGLAIQRVIKGLSSIVVSQYIMNLPVHEWVWIDLHSLYTLGVKIKKENAKVTDISCIYNHTSTIQESYKQIILLNLANPLGLMPKEIVQVYRFAERLTGLMSFGSVPVGGMKKQCMIFQDEDQAAVFVRKEKEIHDDAILYINFGKLYRSLQKKERFKSKMDGRYSTLKISDKAGKPAIELLEYLEHRWRGKTLHGARIFADRLDRSFVVGLNSTYAVQSKDELNAEGEPRLAAKEYIAQSSSEAALSYTFERSGSLSVGSLISFKKVSQEEDKRTLGVVNKLSILKGTEILEFGVSLISSNAHAVLFSEVEKTEEQVKQEALIYNVKLEGGEERSYLIVDSFMLKELDMVRLYLSGQNFPALLRERKNIGLGYWQFDCRRVDRVE